MQAPNKKNIAILCNANAGTGRAVSLADKIDKKLSQLEIDHRLFQQAWPDHLIDYTDIFVAGGDGTLNYFINHYPAIKLPVSIFKGGTGNDIHWLLYGDITFDEQMHLALNATPKPVDLGKCNDKYFINGVGIGFEADVAKLLTGKNKLPGKTSFLFAVLRKICTHRCQRYHIKHDGANISGRQFEIAVYNGQRAGGGFHIAPEASISDGLLDIVIAGSLNIIQRLHCLLLIEGKKHLNSSLINHFQTRSILIESEMPVHYHLDGEYHAAPALEIELLPSALRVRY
jgi:diacylglycerol kinase (ATP)